jgi:sterol desaturase/sphingolipid hydroxylase (fatty acid hydroxylase superfamily)
LFWTQIEGRAYWICFLAAFAAVGLWETFRPRVALMVSSGRRWGTNGLLLFVCAYASMAVFRTGSVLMAVAVEGNRFGLLNKPWIPLTLRCIVAFVLLDLVKYIQHRVSHSIPLLWRLHSVHHSDPDCDLTTGTRNHPLEALLNQGGYLAAIVLLAPPAVAVLAIELVFVFQSFFAHANASLPSWIEKPLRSIFVTPEMHRIHHSEEISEQMSNYGDVFPWWDHLFGTYLHNPAAGQERMRTGLKGFQNAKSANIFFMLTAPFRRLAE